MRRAVSVDAGKETCRLWAGGSWWARRRVVVGGSKTTSPSWSAFGSLEVPKILSWIM